MLSSLRVAACDNSHRRRTGAGRTEAELDGSLLMSSVSGLRTRRPENVLYDDQGRRFTCCGDDDRSVAPDPSFLEFVDFDHRVGSSKFSWPRMPAGNSRALTSAPRKAGTAPKQRSRDAKWGSRSARRPHPRCDLADVGTEPRRADVRDLLMKEMQRRQVRRSEAGLVELRSAQGVGSSRALMHQRKRAGRGSGDFLPAAALSSGTGSDPPTRSGCLRSPSDHRAFLGTPGRTHGLQPRQLALGSRLRCRPGSRAAS